MNNQSDKSWKKFILMDIVLNTAAFIAAGISIYFTNYYIPFGGFMSLFLLLILIPYFLITFIVLILLLLYIKKNKAKLDMAALILQSVAPILWLMIANSLNSGVSWFEIIMFFQIIAGFIGFLSRISVSNKK